MYARTTLSECERDSMLVGAANPLYPTRGRLDHVMVFDLRPRGVEARPCGGDSPKTCQCHDAQTAGEWANQQQGPIVSIVASAERVSDARYQLIASIGEVELFLHRWWQAGKGVSLRATLARLRKRGD